MDDHTNVIFVPVDMPLLSPELISHLATQSGNELIHFEKHYFPMLLSNCAKIREQISKHIKTDQLAIHQLLNAVDSKAINNPFNDQQFLNANTPEQWQQILAICQA